VVEPGEPGITTIVRGMFPFRYWHPEFSLLILRPGMSGFVTELVLFFRLITSPNKTE